MAFGRQSKSYGTAVFFFSMENWWSCDERLLLSDLRNPPTHPSWRFMHERFLSKSESKTSLLRRRKIKTIPAQQHLTETRKTQTQHWTETQQHGTKNTTMIIYNFRKQNSDIPRFNSVLYGKHFLRYLGPFLWNKLDKNITETSSLSRFKFHIRCKDFTELINGNSCRACVICTS